MLKYLMFDCTLMSRGVVFVRAAFSQSNLCSYLATFSHRTLTVRNLSYRKASEVICPGQRYLLSTPTITANVLQASSQVASFNLNQPQSKIRLQGRLTFFFISFNRIDARYLSAKRRAQSRG